MIPEVSWIKDSRRPLCDVPWLGNSLVHADGSLNFCCHSNASIGNVNHDRFERIWNGPKMQEIRRALSNQVLPPECCTSSCPIYRGDDRNYITDRMLGPNAREVAVHEDPHKDIRQRLSGSVIKLATSEKGQMPSIALELKVKGAPVKADIFVAVTAPDGTLAFLPGNESFAIPFRCQVELREQAEPVEILVSKARGGIGITGHYSICAALFQCKQNPNILSNCYWSARSEFNIG